jgi:hypothetical protein
MTDASAFANRDLWIDHKRWHWLLSLTPVILPFVAFGLVSATGINGFWWFGFFFTYGVIVPLELLVGEDPTNPPESAVPALEADPYYKWVVAAFAPLQYAAFVLAAWAAARGGLGPIEMLGLALSTGFMNGVGIANAHELGHKPTRWERWLAKIVLAPTGYGHFVVEHNRGHHVRVATPEDPTSARMGESFWTFWPRTVFGSLRSAWSLEKERLARAGQGPWTPRNDVLNAWIMTPVLFGALILWLGPSIIPFLIVQADRRLLAARSGQLPRTLRPQAPEGPGRSLRALQARAFVELEPRRHQRAALPPATPFRSPRPRHAALSGAAPFRRRAAIADGLRRHDAAGLFSAALAQGDGPAPRRPLRRRSLAHQHPSAGARRDRTTLGRRDRRPGRDIALN